MKIGAGSILGASVKRQKASQDYKYNIQTERAIQKAAGQKIAAVIKRKTQLPPSTLLPEKAATKIQTAIRKKQATKKVKEMLNTQDIQNIIVPSIQTAVRGRIARKKLQALREEKILLNAPGTKIAKVIKGASIRKSVKPLIDTYKKNISKIEKDKLIETTKVQDNIAYERAIISKNKVGVIGGLFTSKEDKDKKTQIINDAEKAIKVEEMALKNFEKKLDNKKKKEKEIFQQKIDIQSNPTIKDLQQQKLGYLVLSQYDTYKENKGKPKGIDNTAFNIFNPQVLDQYLEFLEEQIRNNYERRYNIHSLALEYYRINDFINRNNITIKDKKRFERINDWIIEYYVKVDSDNKENFQSAKESSVRRSNEEPVLDSFYNKEFKYIPGFRILIENYSKKKINDKDLSKEIKNKLQSSVIPKEIKEERKALFNQFIIITQKDIVRKAELAEKTKAYAEKAEEDVEKAKEDVEKSENRVRIKEQEIKKQAEYKLQRDLIKQQIKVKKEVDKEVEQLYQIEPLQIRRSRNIEEPQQAKQVAKVVQKEVQKEVKELKQIETKVKEGIKKELEQSLKRADDIIKKQQELQAKQQAKDLIKKEIDIKKQDTTINYIKIVDEIRNDVIDANSTKSLTSKFNKYNNIKKKYGELLAGYNGNIDILVQLDINNTIRQSIKELSNDLKDLSNTISAEVDTRKQQSRIYTRPELDAMSMTDIKKLLIYSPDGSTIIAPEKGITSQRDRDIFNAWQRKENKQIREG